MRPASKARSLGNSATITRSICWPEPRLVNLSADGLPSSELGETVYANPRLRLTQTLDFRDNPVLPKEGWHLENPLEIGAAVGDISTSYVKAGLTGGWFHEINRHYQIGIGGEWGVLMPGGDGEDLPIDLRLFNGGARSVRSFPERELGPLVDGYPTGGEAMWNTQPGTHPQHHRRGQSRGVLRCGLAGAKP